MTNNGNRFSGLVRVEDAADGVHDKLLEPLGYVTTDHWPIVVDAGFVTDYASIPRFFWRVIPPRGRYNRAAIIHDYLYQNAPIDPKTGQRCTQERADAVLYEACENLDVSRFQRFLIWAGLRVGGWKAWNDYRNRPEDAAHASVGQGS